MPRIRPYTQEVSSQGVLPQVRSATAGDFGGQTAQAVSDFGSTLQTISNHYEKVRKDTLLSGTTAKATSELQEFSYSLQHGTVGEDGTITAPPDPGTHFKLFNDKVTELRDRYGKAFGDNDAALRGLFEKDFGKVALQQSFNVRTNAISRQKDMARAELDETTDTLADIYAKGDAFVRQSVTEQFRGQVTRFVAAGVIDAVDGNKRIDKFMTMTERAQARELVRTNPDAAIDAFQTGEVFKRMPADEQQRWMDIAATASERNRKANIAEQERLRREQERAEREVREVVYKDAIDLSLQGKLTPRWVQANRDKFSKADYPDIMKLAIKGMPGVGGEGPRSSATYADLRIRAGQGQDVRKEAQDALGRGAITPQQFGGIVSEVESSSPTAKGENWYKNGKDYIRTALAPSQINPGIDREVMARALDDWQRFSEANPNATAQERERARDSIVNSSRLVKADEVLTSIPRPKYLVGGRDITADIAGTYKATKDAFMRGEISKSEFEREGRNIRLLDKWIEENKDRVEKAAAEAAKNKGKR